MSFRHAVRAVLAILICVVPSFGQLRTVPRPTTNTYSITGNVRDDVDQQTMENVRVDLKNNEGALVNSAYTRGNGEFEFDSLSSGEYFVEVALKGYDTFQQKVDISRASERGVSISLTRPLTVVNKNSNDPISIHQLGVPHKAHDEFDKGVNLLYAKSDFRGAIAQFQHAIKDFPTYYEAYALEGSAYAALGEMAPAEQSMRKSIELSTGQYPDAIFMLAGLLNNMNRYSDAETFARQGNTLDAASWRGPFELARALVGLKQLEAAEQNAAQARDLKPDNPTVYLILANIHIERRDYDALQKDLTAYIKLVPTGQDADNARKTLDQLQAAMQRAEAQSREEAKEQSRPDARNDAQSQSRPTANGQPSPNDQVHAKEQPQPEEPDTSLLPPLPPPYPANY